nr:ABC transporter ATP-binding protein [Actinokineospora globicatena]
MARRHPADCVSATLWTIAAGFTAVLVPVLLGHLVDAVSDRRPDEAVTFLALTATTALLSAVCAGFARRAAITLAARVAAGLREVVVERVLGMDTSVPQNAGSGDIASRVNEDMEIFAAAVPLISDVFGATAIVIASLAAFSSLDWRLAFAFAVVFPVYALSLRWYLPRAGIRYASERRGAAERSRVVLESLHGVNTVAAYDMAPLQSARVAKSSGEALGLSLRALRLSLWLNKSMNVAEAVGLSLILLTGYWLVQDNSITVGAVAAAALLFHRLFEPLGTVVSSVDEVQRAGASLARVAGVARMPAPVPTPSRAPVGPVSVQVRAVRHSYDGDRFALRHADFTLPAGTSLAIVGASGAGKTTLAAIIAGLLHPTSGQVLLCDEDGGIEPAALDPNSRTAWIGMVAQETHVFAATLRENMTLAVPSADDTQIADALAAVGAHWVHALPAGLDTVVGPSAHQLDVVAAQQLALARVALTDPPLVILDEASAEAGSSVARELDTAAAALLHDRTAIVVAHRLSQARQCDHILVVDGGTIVERGTHDDLLTRGTRYATLWQAWTAGSPL